MKNFALKSFHCFGLFFCLVIVTQKMQKTMYNKMCQVVFERFALFESFTLNRFTCDDNITKHWAGLISNLDRKSRKRKHIGWLILAAPLLVDLLNGAIISKNYTQLGLSRRKTKLAPSSLERWLHKPFKGLCIGPIAGFNQNINIYLRF